MARWLSGTAERLQNAALELFAARGYEQTTTADIAEAVGVTERTFFRHFSDKREVLFHGQQMLADAFLAGVHDAPPDATPMEVGISALRAALSHFPEDRRAHSRIRQSVIDVNPALQEREAHKLVGLGSALAGALRARGVDAPAADVAARTAIMVFGIAFSRWVGDGEERSFDDIVTDVLDELAIIGRELRRRATF
jgi:AcrR family transcriptional regulator